MYNTLNLPIFSLYLKACPGIYLGSNFEKKNVRFILEVVLWDLP